jgi:hypothetical protein
MAALDDPHKKIRRRGNAWQARGRYVLLLTAMIVAWAVSLDKEAPAGAQPDQQIWYIYS